MGISSSNFNLITEVGARLGDFQGKAVLELGNQIMRESHPVRRTSKDYFLGLGVREHVYFDINGEDGALPVDLNKECPEEFWDRFDLVTNFGTSEHISNQFMVFNNVHLCCRVRGYMVHSIPLVGYWKRHCPYHYQADFGEKLAIACGYELLLNEIAPRHNDKFVNFIVGKQPSSECSPTNFPADRIVVGSDFRFDSNNRR